jgi:hypothetical protein
MRRGERRSPEVRRRILLLGVLLSALLAAGRAFQLGVVEGERGGGRWTSRATRCRCRRRAARSTTATACRWREPRSVQRRHRAARDRDRARVERCCASTWAHVAQAARTRRLIAHLDSAPGRFGPEVREALDGVPGIHFERVLQRFYPNGPSRASCWARGPGRGCAGRPRAGVRQCAPRPSGRGGGAARLARPAAAGRHAAGVEPTPGRDSTSPSTTTCRRSRSRR